MIRADGRKYDESRPVEITTGFIKFAEGSALIRCGDTVVLCNASVEDRVPPHVRPGCGWVTAEYSMLPRANRERSRRDVDKLKLSGRSAEIQRLIGRSLRAAVDMRRLGERTITIDCDVLQGDGGTRTASVTGGFVAAPMVHWPEVLMTYDETDKLLLTADAFGTFGALNGALFADEVNFDRDYLNEARRYYTNIVGKYGTQVQAVLKKAAGLDIQMLLPLHGFVWRQDLGYILGKYDLWSRYEPEQRGVVIAYASVYGGTENAANILACRLREQGVQVEMFDTSVTPASYILAAAFRFSHVVLAAPTYNGGVFVTMENLLHDLTAHGLKGRRAAYIENGSWAPTSARGMQKLLEPLNWETAADTVTLRSALRQGQQEDLERMAAQLAESVKA